MLLAVTATALQTGQAWALSEIQREDAPASGPAAEGAIESVPLPAPNAMPPADSAPAEPPATAPTPGEDELQQTGPGDEAPETAEPDADADDAPLPEIIYDLSRLPEPVRRMHGLIVEACKTANIEALRPLLGSGEAMTQLSFGGVEGDPIDFLKSVSGDDQGHEILAILLEVLNAGFVHLEAGTETELYVWPYFFAVPLEKLTPGQRVKLFTIVTAGDYEDMKNYGAYVFYRVGITPEGHWAFFVAGD